MPILPKLDPAIDVVISGHTHNAYICEVPRAGAKPLLLTSAGRYGTLITDVRLTVDPARGAVAHRADNMIVQGEAYSGSGRAGGAAARPFRLIRRTPRPPP